MNSTAPFRVLLAIVFGCFLGSVTIHAAVQAPPQQAGGYKLVFDDEFNSFDLARNGDGPHTWYPGIWFNHKPTPLSNVFVSSSILSLVWRAGQGSDATSISTLSHDAQYFRAWRYGYFEARMRWNVVNGAWPSFWLIPVQDATGKAVYDGVRRTGEIDVFEGMGDEPHTFYGTLHEWINFHSAPVSDNAFHLAPNIDLSQFHTYGLLWVPGRVTWYIDNKPLRSEETPGIFDVQDFFLVLGMQEGRDWTLGNRDDVSAQAISMEVDWVRVWQLLPQSRNLFGRLAGNR